LIAFIDNSIAEKVERMRKANAGHAAAAAEMEQVRAKMAELPSAEERALADAENVLARVEEESRERHLARLEEVKRELADQEAGAVASAQRRLRRELFDKAAREFEEELRKN